jgi:hypothetical protein
LEDLAEGWRLQVIFRPAEVRVVEQVKTLGPELEALELAEVEVFDEQEVDVGNSRSTDHVAAFITELTGLRGGVELLEGRPADLLICSVGLP